MMIARATVLVLDLDDTLYDELDFHESGFAAVARHVAGSRWKRVLTSMLSQFGKQGNPLAVASAECGESIEILLEIHRNHQPQIRLREDARRLFMRLDAIPVPVALLTDGRASTQRAKIRALGIGERLDAIFISEETGFHKPQSGAFRLVEEAFPGYVNFAYIADNPAKDFVTPSGRGWLTAMLKDRGRNVHPQSPELLEPAAPEIVLESLDEIELL